MQRAAAFAGLGTAPRFSEALKAGLPLSRYTVSAPAKDKWRRHEAALAPILPSLQAVEARIRALGNSL